jgi:SET domain-containing protein
MTPAPSMLKQDLYRSPKLAVRRSPVHRWGVFAVEPIAAHELLEESPFFYLDKREIKKAPACEPYTYYFDEAWSIVGLGLAGLYNHATTPNADHQIDKLNEVMRHYSTRAIQAGEEITLHYGDENAANFQKD